MVCVSTLNLATVTRFLLETILAQAINVFQRLIHRHHVILSITARYTGLVEDLVIIGVVMRTIDRINRPVAILTFIVLSPHTGKDRCLTFLSQVL